MNDDKDFKNFKNYQKKEKNNNNSVCYLHKSSTIDSMILFIRFIFGDALDNWRHRWIEIHQKCEQKYIIETTKWSWKRQFRYKDLNYE